MLPSVALPPLLSTLVAEELAGRPPAKARFIDVSTGGSWIPGPKPGSRPPTLHKLRQAAVLLKHYGWTAPASQPNRAQHTELSP